MSYIIPIGPYHPALEEPVHAKLSTEGETLTLSNANGQPVDTVTYDLLRTDTAYIRGADGSWSIGTPSGAQ